MANLHISKAEWKLHSELSANGRSDQRKVWRMVYVLRQDVITGDGNKSAWNKLSLSKQSHFPFFNQFRKLVHIC